VTLTLNIVIVRACLREAETWQAYNGGFASAKAGKRMI
jgi:hypothetical protein